MKFFKNNLKVIIGFVIGVILASSITVYAYSYFASDVKYTDDKSVEDALNELYEIKNNNKSIVKTTILERAFYSPAQSGTYTIDVKEKITNYQELSVENFYIEYYNLRGIGGQSPTNQNDNGITPTIDSYSNGILTYTWPKHVRTGGNSFQSEISIIAFYIQK